MFIFTAKFNKKTAVIIVLALAIILCAIVLIAGRADRTAETAASAASGLNVKTGADRVAYLKSLGLEVESEPIEEQPIVIPKEFSGVYAEYIALQKEQGFRLDEYGGMDAMRYTYRILNYEGGRDDVVADLIIHRNTVIAGDIQCTALDGFMKALK